MQEGIVEDGDRFIEGLRFFFLFYFEKYYYLEWE